MTELYIFAAIGVACVGVSIAVALLGIGLYAVERFSVFRRRREMEQAFVCEGESIIVRVHPRDIKKLQNFGKRY